MKLLDRLVKIISWMTILGLFVLVLRRRLNLCPAPEWFNLYAVPVLTAAAVGYLTNWIAIWLLFKPYEKHWGFLQGVIPRNKERLGRELGEIIPQYLLNPGELATRMGSLVKDSLQNPELLNDIRRNTALFLQKHGAGIADAIVPGIEDMLDRALREHLTPERLSTLCGNGIGKYLNSENTREMVSRALISELRTRTPEIALLIRNHVRTGAEAYIREKYPLLCNLLKADLFAGKLVGSLDWRQIEKQLRGKLATSETRLALSGELNSAAARLRDYLKSEEGQIRLNRFLSENRGNVRAFIRENLTGNLPGIVDEWLRRDELWKALEHHLLPAARAFILHRLKRGRKTLIQKLDLPGKIEESVSNMNVAQVHEMLLRASDDNLTVIQLLGYFLGALAGILLTFAG